jgi:hypothetical protein
MKKVLIKKLYLMVILAAGLLPFLSACEQEGVTPKLDAAPGGGTLSTYKAYALDSIAGMKTNVYGRVVFWKNNNNTLVQVSLYNTKDDATYPTGIFAGAGDAGVTTKLMELYAVNGATGEFSNNKFYVISDKDFYASLEDIDAHVEILSGSTRVSFGDVGSNALPVAQSN